MNNKYTIALFLCLIAIGSTAQELKLNEIMAGNDFIGIQPDNQRWAPDSKTIYFDWGEDDLGYANVFSYDLESGETKQLNDYEKTQIPQFAPISDDTKTHWYFENKQSIFKYENGKSKIVFSFYEQFQLLKVLPSGALVLRIGDQLVEYDSDKGTFMQLVKIIPPLADEEENFLEKQQLELFEIVRKREPKVLREGSSLPELEIKDELDWVEISNDKSALLYQDSKFPKTDKTVYASYVTSDGHTRSKRARPKVGRPDPSHTLNFIDMRSNIHHRIDISNLEGINDHPDYYKYYDKRESEKRKVIFHNHGSNPKGNIFLVEIKSYDNKDRWICTVDQQGELKELDHQRDTAWIGGPGISGWTSVAGNLGWINDESVFFQSEESGYSHLYSFDLTKNKKTQLTEGNWEVHEATLNKERTHFYITANHNHPGNREFYILDIKKKRMKGILTTAGNHQIAISPDEKQLAVRYSYINQPWEMHTAPLSENAQLKKITNSLTEEFKTYKWREPAVINFEASDKKNVYARMYFPEKDKANGAAVIFVHGAGYLQNAHNWWSGYYREFMFNNLLADKGYTVMDIDYRASKGYGRDWRTSIYRHMGGKDLSDHIDARQFLVDTYKIDPKRIGIYGGSYGGFITLMALLNHPGDFACGAALRSVTDWAHYNHPYSSNILNTPELDPIAYERSSPIYFAENLVDPLLMLHGIEDGNVQYQDVVRLSQRFIELGKTNWDLIGYPIEGHGFKETTSWTDEYRRILELFDEHLLIKE